MAVHFACPTPLITRAYDVSTGMVGQYSIIMLDVKYECQGDFMSDIHARITDEDIWNDCSWVRKGG